MAPAPHPRFTAAVKPASAVLSVGAAGAACVAYGTFVERHWFRRRELVLPGALTAAATGPVRILHLSDLHHRPALERQAAFVRGLRDTAYDLVVVTGDLVGDQGVEDTDRKSVV